MKTGVLAAAVVCSLALALPGGAVTGGTLVSPAPSWAAFIVVKHNRSTSVCSGALVGSSWILTAAQCVAPTKKSPCKFLNPYRANSFTVYLGRTRTFKGTAYRVSSVQLHHASSTKADRQCVLRNDVALLHLSKATTRSPLWIAPTAAAVTHGTPAVLYGYGIRSRTKAKSYGWLNSTITGKWTVDTQCDLASRINATCVDRNRKGGPAGSAGDNGGPWTMTVDGNPVEALVFSGYDSLHGFAYGTGVTQASTSAWLHTKLGVPNVAPGTIVHDSVSGDSWLIDPQGYRRPIPDAGTYSCLMGKGGHVVDLPAEAIQRMAAREMGASCIGPGSGVLIAGAGDGGYTEPDDNLAALFTSAGYDVTESATLPSDLSSFSQVWWVDINAPSSAEQDQLVSFEGAGGGLFLTGERSTCCSLLDAADTAIINSVVVGGGVTAGGAANDCTCNSAIPVNPDLGPDLLLNPFVIDHWTPSQAGGMAGVPDSSVFAAYQPGDISTRRVVGAAWDGPSLVGQGRLVVFMDVNWTEAGFRDPNWSDVAQNVALFLSGLSDPPGTPVAQG